MVKLSVVISAYNEEKKIEECLKSVKFADEIILVDNTSTDKTVEIARKYTSKIYSRPNNRMLNINKNFGFSKATCDWILSLDADERVAPELQNEILSTINHEPSTIDGYWIPRKNIIFNKWIQHTGWYPDYQLRLFRREKGRFEEKHVHEMVKIQGDTKKLAGYIIHLNYENINQFLYKHIDIYSDNEAENLVKKGYSFNYLDAIRFPLKEFLSRYFAREGYKDGFYGLILSILMGFYHFIIFTKLWEKENYKDNLDNKFLNEAEKEFKKSNKELAYWFLTGKLKSVKNPIEKLKLKIKRKIL